MNKKGAAGNLFVGHNILITNCAILFCGYCTAGASNSYFVTGTHPVFGRYGGVFGSNGDGGYASSTYSARATVVCGAGLLYKKWYNENRYCTAGASNSVSTVGVYPIYSCYLGLFGRNSSAGAGGLDISTRATVVCGAGLLCKKWYNENGYCTAGASDSGIVFATYPIAIRVRNFFGSGSVGGGGSENSSARATVVCGAGLLYEKRYNKDRCCVVGVINNQ